ncbi:hypothetical protein [Hyunsoonleella rubra]|uniref:3-hydroxymyristoyl/3-hydroxydecanoyl-(Acyl carrier protein) dehydratase n=1 Tax=Hyunsoonleella rubra TaxID=1737062 RepID=A0ABW5TC71_9FLAO
MLPISNIEHLIPQKVPFIMVDTLAEFSQEHVVSNYTIPEDNLFINNGELLAPGIIENMAQTVALHTGYDYLLRNEKAPTGYIGSIKKVEIISLPSLSDVITTKAVVLHEFMGVTMVKVEVFNVENEILAFGEMKTVIAPDA